MPTRTVTFAWIIDPDGNKVELWQPKFSDTKPHAAFAWGFVRHTLQRIGRALERRLVPEVDEAGAAGRRDREVVSHPRRARFREGRAHLCPTGLQDLAHHVHAISETGE